MSFTACGGDSSAGSADGGGGQFSGNAMATGEGPCEEPGECQGGVCVALIDGDHPPVYCTQECGSCPDGFWCDTDTFALAGLSFCRFGDDPIEPPPPPSEPPRLPCKDDDDCEGDLVCAEFMGERDCTKTCNGEDACAVTLGGLTFDLHECAEDQRPDETRDVCLPDLACFPNATSCIGGFPGF